MAATPADPPPAALEDPAADEPAAGEPAPEEPPDGAMAQPGSSDAAPSAPTVRRKCRRRPLGSSQLGQGSAAPSFTAPLSCDLAQSFSLMSLLLWCRFGGMLTSDATTAIFSTLSHARRPPSRWIHPRIR